MMLGVLFYCIMCNIELFDYFYLLSCVAFMQLDHAVCCIWRCVISHVAIWSCVSISVSSFALHNYLAYGLFGILYVRSFTWSYSVCACITNYFATWYLLRSCASRIIFFFLCVTPQVRRYIIFKNISVKILLNLFYFNSFI